MLEKFTAILILDIRVHWKMLLGMITFACAIPTYAYITGDHRVKIVAMLFGFTFLAVPVISPWWLVGNDRSKGTIWLLVSLPLSRLQLALVKCTEVVALSSVVFTISVAIASALGLLGSSDLTQFIIAAPLFYLPIALLATGLFLVFPARIAMFPLYVIFFGLLKLSNEYLPVLQKYGNVALYLLILCALCALAGAAFLTCVRLWSIRPSPAEV